MPNQLIYGFHQLADVKDERAIEIDREIMISAIDMSQAEHNSMVEAHLGLFAQTDTVHQLKFRGSLMGESQPLDENGRPRPIKGGSEYTCSFPILTSGNAMGSNFITSKKITVEQLSDVIGAMYMGDFKWIRRQILGALFTNTGYNIEDPVYGTLPIVALANGDATKYAFNGTDLTAVDDHYLAQAAAIADATNPFPTIYDELMEHPENAGTDVVCFIPTNQKAATRGLATFYEVADPNLSVGSGVTTLAGTISTTLPASAKLIGYCQNVWIAEWPRLPDNYLLATCVGGTPALKMREDEEAELRGFRPQGVREDFPYRQDIWFRRAGFGGWNRTAAVVCRIGNAAYAIPAGYTAPLP